MTDELLERLNDRAHCGKGVDSLCLDAAAEITRLREVCREQQSLLAVRHARINALDSLVRALRDVNASQDGEQYPLNGGYRNWVIHLEQTVLRHHARIEELTHALDFIGKSADLFIKADDSRLPEVSRSPAESSSSTCEGGTPVHGTAGQASPPLSNDLREAVVPPAAGMPTP